MILGLTWRTFASLIVASSLLAIPATAEPLSFSEARKSLPRANAKSVISLNEAVVPARDRAKLERTNQSLSDVLKALGSAVPSFGAVAISPSEGLFVEWLNGAGQFHNASSARAAALRYCEGKRKRSSQRCQIVVQVKPRGAKENAALSLSATANAALRGPYRKLKSPKAFAISDATGNFGFDRGDGGRALAACKSAGKEANDCRIVVAD